MFAYTLLRDICLQVLFLPVLLVVLVRAFLREGGWRAVGERLGRRVKHHGPTIWLHGASNGEMTSARPLIHALHARWPKLHIAATVNTATARNMVNNWGDPRVTASLAPVDTYAGVNRFLNRVQPRALVIVENELWPIRLTQTAKRGIPVIVASARLSERSLRGWQRFATPLGLTRAVIGTISHLFPQDEASARRFKALGLPPDRIGPVINLKAATLAPTDLSLTPVALPRADTILAASTHDGEEAIILDAFRSALTQRPGLHLILAPRHARRRDAIEALITQRDLPYATRSRGAEPDATVSVYLADSMGEMPRWYAAASVTFVGGSLTDRGGHTPFEPAAARSAIIHGPDVANFADAYAALTPDGAVCVSDATGLAAAMVNLAGAPDATLLADRARVILTGLSTVTDLRPLLDLLSSALGPRLR